MNQESDGTKVPSPARTLFPTRFSRKGGSGQPTTAWPQHGFPKLRAGVGRGDGLALDQMNLLRWLAIVLFTVSSPALPGQELSDAQWELESLSEEGGFSFQPDTGIATAVNGLRVRYLHPEFGEAVLQADRVTLDQLSGQITAEGGVTLQRDGQVWRGDQLDYNFNTQVMGASNYRTGKTPFFAAGTVIEGANHPPAYRASEAFVTTDDAKSPNHRIRAKQIKIVPGQYFSARHATVYLGKVPVMYFPYLRANLDREGNHWSLTPGYRSRFGGFLLSTYQFNLFTNLTANLHFDYRTRRGAGVGPDFRYDLGRFGTGETKTYYLHDDLPGFEPGGRPISRQWRGEDHPSEGRLGRVHLGPSRDPLPRRHGGGGPRLGDQQRLGFHLRSEARPGELIPSARDRTAGPGEAICRRVLCSGGRCRLQRRASSFAPAPGRR